MSRYTASSALRINRELTLIFLLLGLAAVGWAGYGLVTGKGHYKGCPPGGFDPSEHPFNFWAPTIVILAVGVFLILIYAGVISLPAGVHAR